MVLYSVFLPVGTVVVFLCVSELTERIVHPAIKILITADLTVLKLLP